jgi:hypothetical protein
VWKEARNSRLNLEAQILDASKDAPQQPGKNRRPKAFCASPGDDFVIAVERRLVIYPPLPAWSTDRPEIIRVFFHKVRRHVLTRANLGCYASWFGNYEEAEIENRACNKSRRQTPDRLAISGGKPCSPLHSFAVDYCILCAF